MLHTDREAEAPLRAEIGIASTRLATVLPDGLIPGAVAIEPTELRQFDAPARSVAISIDARHHGARGPPRRGNAFERADPSASQSISTSDRDRRIAPREPVNQRFTGDAECARSTTSSKSPNGRNSRHDQ